MPLPDHLNVSHLKAVMLPDTPVEGDQQPVLVNQLAKLNRRVEGRLEILDAWIERLPRLPAPPVQQSLQELVQAARHRLRSERARDDRLELDARAAVINHVRDGLL